MADEKKTVATKEPQFPVGGAKNIQNPPRRPEFYPPWPWAPYLWRGDIRRTDDSNNILYFMFNPASLRLSYGIDNNALLPALDTTLHEIKNISGVNTVSFTIAFDRTYEVYENPGDDRPLVDQLAGERKPSRGVLDDITALEALGGMENGLGGFAPFQCLFWFQHPLSFSFHGFISSVEVELLQFSHKMIPVRGTVAITARRDPAASHEPPPEAHKDEDPRASLPFWSRARWSSTELSAPPLDPYAGQTVGGKKQEPPLTDTGGISGTLSGDQGSDYAHDYDHLTFGGRQVTDDPGPQHWYK